MLKKLFTILFVFAFSFVLFAQQDADPNAGPVNPPSSIMAQWDVLLQFDASAISGAAGNAGAEWDGTSFYTTRWASNLIHEYSADGTTLIREFSIPGVSGLRDLAYDGQYFYGGAAANTIYQMDFSTNTLIGTIPTTEAVRHIAYDSDNDAFWVGNWSTDIVLISRTGTELARITANPSVTSNYGSAYDNVSAGGPYLWVFSQGGGAGTPQFVNQLHLPDGTPTGVAHDVLTDVGVGGTLSIAGGLFCMTDFASGFVTLGGLLQGNPIGDQVFVYELEAASGGNSFFDDFESYTSGVQLCTQTSEWETWSDAPGSGEDPFVSSNYSYSGSNSVVIVQNNDLVRMHGDLTSGTWYMSFVFYIPAGKSGYFNTMNEFTRPSTFTWGMDSYFDVGGGGRLDTTGGGGIPASVAFNWTEDAWNQVVVKVDLDNSVAEYWIGTNPGNFSMVASWDWTQGGTKPNQLAVNDIFGAAATDEMYMDDYYFGDQMPSIIPVELSSFAANVNNGQVVLNWTTASEINNQMFEVQRSSQNSEFVTIGYVDGAGTTTEEQQYSYTDRNVNSGTYTYRLKQIDFDGRFTYSDVVEVDVVGPLTFELKQNYPNPFNPTTNIKYNIPTASNVKLAVYNVVGEEVAILVNGYTEAGFHETTFDASNLPSGVYIYKLQSGNLVQTNKMMLLK